MAGVTNALLAIAEQSARGQLIGAIRSVEGLRERHMQEAERLLGDTEECAELCGEMSAMIDELAHLTEALNTLGDVTPRSLDAIASYGEQLSSQLVVAAFRRCGLPAEHVDARDVMITDDAFTRAEPNVDAISEASQRLLAPLARDGRIPVLGGFIGSTTRHLTTTLGGKSGVTLIRLRTPRMLLTEGFMRTTFDVFHRHRASVDVVATSEVSVSLTIDDASRLDALLPDLRELGDVSIERSRGIVAVVGADLSAGGEHMARALRALSDTPIHMLSLSATGINLTMVVDGEQVTPVMQRLHDEFFGDGVPAA